MILNRVKIARLEEVIMDIEIEHKVKVKFCLPYLVVRLQCQIHGGLDWCCMRPPFFKNEPHFIISYFISYRLLMNTLLLNWCAESGILHSCSWYGRLSLIIKFRPFLKTRLKLSHLEGLKRSKGKMYKKIAVVASL